MDIAWIDGQPATRDESLRAAGELLLRARQPLITGLRTDVSGLRAAFSFARHCGGIIDHGQSASLYALVSAVRDGGAFLAAPAEMRRRADRVLIVGDMPGRIGSDILGMLSEVQPDLGVGTRGTDRRFMALSRQTLNMPGGTEVSHLDCASEAIVDVLGMVRAKLAGRRIGEGALGEQAVGTIGSFLSEAAFACVVFAPEEFGDLGTQQIFGLVSDLNETIRASTLPVLTYPDAMGAALQATWTSGFPLRVSYGRGLAEHDPALLSSERQLSAEGEADLVVHIDSLPASGSPRTAFSKPAIVITAAEDGLASANVVFKVAAAARDHDGVLYDAQFGSFVAVAATTGSELPTAADILAALAELIGQRDLVAA